MFAEREVLGFHLKLKQSRPGDKRGLDVTVDLDDITRRGPEKAGQLAAKRFHEEASTGLLPAVLPGEPYDTTPVHIP